MENVQQRKWLVWIAPAFFIALVAVFVLLPFPLNAKLDGVCWGI
jgi:hypothetical protein